MGKCVTFNIMAYRRLKSIKLVSPSFIALKIPNVRNSSKKAMVITWNSLKTQNSLSGEFWVLSYDFLPYANFSVTHGIMLGRHGGKCLFQLMRLTKC